MDVKVKINYMHTWPYGGAFSDSMYYQQTPLYRSYMQLMTYHVRMLILPTCHAALGRCGEAQGKATHLRDLVSKTTSYVQ